MKRFNWYHFKMILISLGIYISSTGIISTARGQKINIDNRKNMKYDADRRLQVLDFGEVKTGVLATNEIFIEPDKGLVITGIETKGGFNVVGETNYTPKRKSSIELEFDSHCKLGEYKGEALIETNGPMKRRVIGFKIKVVESDFSLSFVHDTLNYSPLQGEHSPTFEFKIINTGEASVDVPLLWSKEGFVELGSNKKILRSGETLIIVARYPKEKLETILENDFISITAELRYCNGDPKAEQHTFVIRNTPASQ